MSFGKIGEFGGNRLITSREFAILDQTKLKNSKRKFQKCKFFGKNIFQLCIIISKFLKV